MTNSVYTAEQAKASDRILASLTEAMYKTHDTYLGTVESLHYVAGDKKVRRNGWAKTTEEVIAAATTIASNPDATPAYRVEQAKTRVDAFTNARTAWHAAQNAVLAHDHEWANHGRWSRFFLVTGGHIHSSTSCRSLRITTRIGWLPEVSGDTEKEAVEAYGTILCTHCFPTAPVEWTIGNQDTDPSTCPGSGDYVPNVNMRRVSKYGTCTTCSETVSVTSLGKARKHKLPNNK